MSKKLNNMKWESVALDGFPASMTDKFQGFVGLEECTDYSFDKEGKRSKKNKKQEKLAAKRERKKRKSSESETKEVPTKKVKLDNGFIVESCDNIEPSLANNKQKRNKNKKKKNKKAKNLNNDNNTGNTSEDDKEYGNTEEVPKKKKSKNKKKKVKETVGTETVVKKVKQRLGRRDILGAAETGSGKTLAFGLPILCGILKLKEKAELKGLDVYDIPYRKPALKKKEEPKEKKQKFKRKDRKENKKKIVQEEEKVKESSEDGYSSGKESDEEGTKNVTEGTKNVEEEYLEEYDVPVRKRDNSADEGNDSDEENYIHLSDMLDSDDFADSSDDEAEGADDEDGSGIDDDGESGDDIESGGEDDSDASGDIDGDGSGDDEDLEEEEENDDADEVNEDEQGVGCVKVVDNIEMPGHVSVKTGKPLYALILTPTRELAIQISRHLIAAAKYTGIKVATIVGGMAAVKQERVLRSGPEIVVATPGRLWELIGQGQPHLQQLDSVKFLAIDETDRMVERGHFEELTPLLERLNADEERRAARQNFVFSATLTMVHDLPTHMKGKKVCRIYYSTAETLTESRITCALEHKDAYLYYIVKRHPGRTIVFCNSIGSVKRLAQLFTLLKCRPLPLHASMPQRQRIKNLERFRDDPHGVLIATDVAARGLDIPHVEHVIHYQVPRTAENYVHRSGRTARASREGLTILMMDPSEAYLYAKMCRTLNKTSEVPTFPVDSQVLAPIKELMVVARELDALELKKRRAAQAHGWKERAAREMDIIIDDDDLPVKQVNASIDKELKTKRRQLDSLLSRPIYPRGFSFKYPTLNNDTTAFQGREENALQVMKNALESGQLKKEKRKSKNAPLLQLQKKFKKK
ncbi:hypothetical protein SFRURICE_003151 [Spodoptera frugiperda]|nr:hypothetical protein SFRURICE_003151 [Spodoptera frugiperda]